MLEVTIKNGEEGINLKNAGGAEKRKEEAVRVEPISVELVARPVFDPKLNFWYTGTPPALEEPLVEVVNGETVCGKMPSCQSTEASDNLVFDPKLNFWFTKRSEQQQQEKEEEEEEGKAAATREKMEREGRAIMEEEKAAAKREEEKCARAAASVYDQMRLKAIEDSKAEAAAKIKAAKEAKVLEDLMKKKEELETKIGKKQTKPKTAVAVPAVEACVMGQRELAKKKKEDLEKKSEESEECNKKATSDKEAEKEEVTEKKAFSLPMDDDSDDWMLDDDIGAMIEEEEEEDKSEKTKVSEKLPEIAKVEGGAKKVAFSLPMDDDSDDWMLDDDMGAMIDDEDEEEESTFKTVPEENVKEMSGKVEKGEEEIKPDLAEKKSFALPLDDASDDWMIDDDVGTMMEDEEEEETENVQKEKESSSKEAKVETEVTEKKSFSLPLDDASDDWMVDDDVGAMIEEEDDAEVVLADKEVQTSSSKGSEVEKKSFSLPLDDASDDWMLDEDVGKMVEEDEGKAGSPKEETGTEESKQRSAHLVSDKKIPVDKPMVEEMEEKATVSEEKKPTEKGETQSQKKSKKNKNKKK